MSATPRSIPAEAERVLQYWFGDPSPRAAAEIERRIPSWFGKRPEDDRKIEIEFGTLIAAAASGALASWAAQPRSALALIVLRDQFSRVLHRGSARAFELDSDNLALARAAVADRFDLALSAVERVFLYMPYMHSESLDAQVESVALYRRLARSGPRAVASFLGQVCTFAERHHEIVARFGRYPHRNPSLGRTTTDEERLFLQQPNSAF